MNLDHQVFFMPFQRLWRRNGSGQGHSTVKIPLRKGDGRSARLLIYTDTVTVATVLTRAYGSLTTRHLIYGPVLACQVTIQGYIYVAHPPPP